jgi:glycosyltransferase involved in cell wall biosynthesis
MHVMFIHPNFPAQFGHVAMHLSTRLGWPCTFVTGVDTSSAQLPFSRVTYRLGSAPQGSNDPSKLKIHTEGALSVYASLKGLPQIQPDLVVGHMTYGTLLYLKVLYPKAKFIGYYELMPPPFWSDAMALRKEYPPPEHTRLFNATFHAMNLLQTPMLDAAYTPTQFQFNNAPDELKSKLRVIFDGVDVEFLRRKTLPRPFTFRGATIGPNTRVVTFASRGLESIRGFDIFMKVAKRISREMSDVIFLIAGDERTYYGHELHHLGGRSFKQFVLSQDSYDPRQFVFLGSIPPQDLATMFSLSDLHIYLTVPFVLSWSMIWSMAAGCTILGSRTAPVMEAIDDGAQGLLADFYDVDELTDKALTVLRDPQAHRHLGEASHQRVLERYEMSRCIGELVTLFQAMMQ